MEREIRPLSEVASVRSGFMFKSSDWRETGVPVIKIGNVKQGFITLDGCSYVDEQTAEAAREFELKPSDIVIAMTGYVGEVAIVGPIGRALLNQRVGRFQITDPEALTEKYLFYYLRQRSVKDELVSIAHGSAQANLSASGILGINISLPSISDQRATAEILGALDDKIATNTKLTQTALKLSRTKFKHLLKKTTNKASLKDVLSLEYGKSLPATKRHDGDVDVFGSGGIVGTHNAALLPGPGVVVGRKGTAGTVHWAPRAYFPIDTTYYVVPRNPSTSLIFCMHLLETLGLNEMNSDSAVPGLNREEALATQVLIPEASDIQKFTESSTRLFDVIDQANAESRTLASMRDTLLPRLMSGKLTVKQAEEIVASAV